jgi:hypothetical protein
MSLPKPALEEVTGFLGVGSLQLLGAFLVIDGLTGFWVLLEIYAKSASFAILFTVPLLVISYVLGLLSSLGAEAAAWRLWKPVLGSDLLAQVLTLSLEPLTARYIEVERHTRLLYGSSLALLLLAVGSVAELRNLEKYGSVGFLCAGIGVALAVLCPMVAFRLQREFGKEVQAVQAARARRDA